jgi:hypothetical protein
MARPRFKPSAKDSENVQMLSAYGVPEEQIADTIGPRGISAKTLRKYFHRELASGMMKGQCDRSPDVVQNGHLRRLSGGHDLLVQDPHEVERKRLGAERRRYRDHGGIEC